MWVRFATVLVGLSMAGAGALVAAGGQAETTRTTPTDLQPALVVFTMPGYAGLVDRTAGARVPLLAEEAWGIAVASGVPDGCGHTMQVSVGGDARIEEPAHAVWTLEARKVSVDGDTATVDLRWTRAVHEPGLQPDASITTEQRMVLREGGRGILDVVTGPANSEGVCPAFAVGVGLEFGSDADVPDAGLEYDFWLVRSGRTERPTRARAVARQGHSTRYAFQPLALASDGSPASDARATMNWSGAITGRARSDGTIDLSVDAFVAVMDAERSSSKASSSLRKQLRVRDGETVDIEFPATSWHGLAPSYAWERTVLRVTARRVW